MKYHRIKCEIYKAEGKTWERMAEELLLSAVRRERVVRLIFFTACKDNQEYRQQRTFLEQWADSHFPSPRPVVSVVAQKPLEGELVLEVHSLPLSVDEAVTLEERFASSVRYLRITSADYREIIAGGLCADDLNLPIREQSEQTFRKVEEILKAEQMNLVISSVNGIIWKASRILHMAISAIRILMMFVPSSMLLRSGSRGIRQQRESERSMVVYRSTSMQ